MNASAQPASSLLPAATLEALHQLSSVVGERGHAQIWAINFREKNDRWPTPGQIVIGVKADTCISISRTTAWRALVQIRGSRKPRTE